MAHETTETTADELNATAGDPAFSSSFATSLPTFIAGDSAGYYFPERLSAALSDQVHVTPTALRQIIHLILSACLGDHKRVRKVRSEVWTLKDRRRAAYEMFHCLVMERDEPLKARWGRLLLVLPWIDEHFSDAVPLLETPPTVTTFIKVVVACGALPLEQGDTGQRSLDQERSREERCRLVLSARATQLSEEEVEDLQVADRADIGRRIELTRICHAQLEPFARAQDVRLPLAQAMAGILNLSLADQEALWVKLSPLSSGRRADALNAFLMAVQARTDESAGEKILIGELLAVLCSLDPAFSGSTPAEVGAALARARSGQESPEACLARLILDLPGGALGLSGSLQAIKKGLTSGAHADV